MVDLPNFVLTLHIISSAINFIRANLWGKHSNSFQGEKERHFISYAREQNEGNSGTQVLFLRSAFVRKDEEESPSALTSSILGCNMFLFLIFLLNGVCNVGGGGGRW
jgi:hypothetical protein